MKMQRKACRFPNFCDHFQPFQCHKTCCRVVFLPLSASHLHDISLINFELKLKIFISISRVHISWYICFSTVVTGVGEHV